MSSNLSNSERLLSEAMSERRATLSFDGSPVPDRVLSRILRAGIEAPSSFNLQPWRFIIVRNIEQKRRLREAAMGQAKVEEAGVVIVCCGDPNAPRGRNLDNVFGLAPDYAVWVNRHVMVAFTSMMWMSEVLGYDTAPMEGFFEDQVKRVLQIPDGIRVVGLLGIGKRKGPDKRHPGRHELRSICFAEAWGEHVSLDSRLQA